MDACSLAHFSALIQVRSPFLGNGASQGGLNCPTLIPTDQHCVDNTYNLTHPDSFSQVILGWSSHHTWLQEYMKYHSTKFLLSFSSLGKYLEMSVSNISCLLFPNLSRAPRFKGLFFLNQTSPTYSAVTWYQTLKLSVKPYWKCVIFIRAHKKLWM